MGTGLFNISRSIFMSDELKKIETRDVVPLWYFQAFQLRLMGVGSEKIATALGMSKSSVDKLFYKNGPYYPLWREFAETAVAENKERSMDMMHGHLPVITQAAVETAKMMNMTGVAQRNKVFDYTLGKPKERVELNATVGVYSLSDWAKQQMEEIKTYEAETIEQSGATTAPVAEESS